MPRRLIPNPRLYGINHRLRMKLTGHATLYGPRSRLHVSDTAHLSNLLVNTNCGSVDIGDHVFFGHDVLLLTGTHDFRKTGPSRLPPRATVDRSIVVEPGAWIASGAIIIGPCRIGANAVIGCGCIIDFDVPADMIIRVRQEFTMDTIRYFEPQRQPGQGMPSAGAWTAHSTP